MWHSGKNYTDEEWKIVKEHEYYLFMYNPGFRAMWHNNFEEYWKGLRDEEYWERREEEREKELAEIVRENMKDPEYASRMNEITIIEETLFGNPETSPIARSRWFEREQMLKEMENYDSSKKWRNDELLKTAKNWGMDLLKIIANSQEKTKNIHLFRVQTNVLTVSGKIVGALSSGDNEALEEYLDDYQWQLNRVDYTLSLISLKRCLESLTQWKLENNNSKEFDKFSSQGRLIQQQLLDRLDEIEQRRLKRKSRK